jgi:hypothetical protein
VRHQPSEGSSFEFGAGLVVHGELLGISATGVSGDIG